MLINHTRLSSQKAVMQQASKSNVTWIKTMRGINHFLLFHRRQNGRAYIKRHILGRAGGGGGGGLPFASLSKQMARDFFVLLHTIIHFCVFSKIFTSIDSFTSVDLYPDVSASFLSSFYNQSER